MRYTKLLKSLNVLCTVLLSLTSGGVADGVLVRLSLIEQTYQKCPLPQRHIFNKVNRGIVQKPDKVEAKNLPVRWLLLRQMFAKI